MSGWIQATMQQNTISLFSAKLCAKSGSWCRFKLLARCFANQQNWVYLFHSSLLLLKCHLINTLAILLNSIVASLSFCHDSSEFFYWQLAKEKDSFFSIYYHFRGFKSSCLSVLMTLLIVRFIDTTIKKIAVKVKELSTYLWPGLVGCKSSALIFRLLHLKPF